jgi:cyclic pyranopterin phosphate synthase
VEDRLSRTINYLRLSITDRCNLRCFYCTPVGEWVKLPAAEILRYEEMLRIVEVAAGLGISKVRVTGGEPLMRRDVVNFVKGLHQVAGLREVCLTTNGVRLGEMASALYGAGLRHLNLSLDTLRRDRYWHLTGSDNFREALAGLEQAEALGFKPLKINCVALRGINDDEFLDFALLARDRPLQVRFIELMPTGSRELWARHFLPIEEVRRRLSKLGPLKPLAAGATAGPARIFQPPGFRGELGFITPISEHHCATCNRLRLTAAGGLRPCLFATREIDLKGPLRQGVGQEALERLFKEAVRLKADGPHFRFPETPSPGRPMVSSGG